MELIRNLDQQKGVNREILRAIVGICRKLGIHTLAEGVENEEQEAFLDQIGCDLVQGYYLHRPEPLDTILYRCQHGQRVHQMVTDERRKHLI